MKKFKQFKEYIRELSEALDNPVDVKWDKAENSWIGSFSIDETSYEITIKNYSTAEKHYLFKFTANKSYELVNDSRKALRVIPTIENAVNEFFDEVNPDALIFIASDVSEGRKKFYTRYCEKIQKANRTKLDFFTERLKDEQLFCLSKYSCDGVELALSIDKIRKEHMQL